MRKQIGFGVAVILALVFAGCGGHTHFEPLIDGLVGIDNRPEITLSDPLLRVEYTLPGSPAIFVANILSDRQASGDIAFDPVLNAFFIANGPGTIFFGIDQSDPNFPEYRAFLDFPLGGSTQQDVVPLNAIIVSATLDVFINEVSFSPTVPTLLDLVTYDILQLKDQDFNSVPILFRRLDFFSFDVGNVVRIDVTPMMEEAQRLGFSDFQVRFLLDFP